MAEPGCRSDRASPDRFPRKRLTGEERRASIVEVAATLFAEAGFGASTRDLAARLHVTQALIYRYFPSKEALIEAVFEAALAQGGRRDWATILGGAGSLEERLTRLYTAYLGTASRRSMRLFARAGLDGLGLPARFGARLTSRLLAPVVAALRREAALPGFDAVPLMRGERELVMALHGGMMFLGVRKHVYGMPMPDDLSEPVALLVRTFLPGAMEELGRIHAGASAEGLRLRSLAPRPG